MSKVTVTVEIPGLEELHIAARHVLYVVHGDHENGLEPGGFLTGLIEVMLHADRHNMNLLSRGFPAYATAVTLYKDNPYGVSTLTEWATQTPSAPMSEGPSQGERENNG